VNTYRSQIAPQREALPIDTDTASRRASVVTSEGWIAMRDLSGTAKGS